MSALSCDASFPRPACPALLFSVLVGLTEHLARSVSDAGLSSPVRAVTCPCYSDGYVREGALGHDPRLCCLIFLTASETWLSPGHGALVEKLRVKTWAPLQ